MATALLTGHEAYTTCFSVICECGDDKEHLRLTDEVIIVGDRVIISCHR